MLPPEVMRQLNRLHLRARRAVRSLLGGEYHSIFKGTGLRFEEVREYQPGDDVRGIDWNVTARMGTPFIKRFVEERELTVLLVADLSRSLRFGTAETGKRTVAVELAALLAFAAISNNDRVGLLLCTDVVERAIHPNKGSRHVLRLLRDILFFEPQRPGTDLRNALDYLHKIQRKRAIVVLLSDFLDRDWEQPLKRIGHRHDLIVLHITDPRESELPTVGLVQLEDAETGRQLLLETAAAGNRRAFTIRQAARLHAVRRSVASAQADYVAVSTSGGHFDALLRFFHSREQRRRRSP